MSNEYSELDQLADELSCTVEITMFGPVYMDATGDYHRINGPAVKWPNGECWYYHGKRHRLGGPALIYSGGNQFWYIDDVQYSKEDYENHPSVIAYAKSKT